MDDMAYPCVIIAYFTSPIRIILAPFESQIIADATTTIPMPTRPRRYVSDLLYY